MTPPLTVPHRTGPLPETSSQLPHSQLTQHGPDAVIDALHTWCFALPDVANQHSLISVPGSRALVLCDGVDCDPAAFMVGREFAHIHPHPDNGSMHVQLRAEDAAAVIDAGWGESHYLVTQGHLPFGLVLVFSPRDADELETVKRIVARSHAFATGQPPPP
ncbi:MAG: hypothetical protein AAF460_07390 [Pseudomonadota bacterium]